MPIIATDIVFYLSAPGAASGFTTPGTAGSSLGKWCSTTPFTPGKNTLFPDVSEEDNAASLVDHACVFVYNGHPTLTLFDPRVYLAAQVAGGVACAIGADPSGVSPRNAGTQQALTVGSPASAPLGVVFTAPTTPETGIAVGDIPPGQVRAVWVRRTAANTPAVLSDGATLAVTGNTV